MFKTFCWQCSQPWSTSQTNSDYYAYGSYNYNLYDQTGQADWGYNPINNGGNIANQWRTLTWTEWRYILAYRTTPSGILYAKAKVNNVNGLILLPDNWSSSTYSLNAGATRFDGNTITIAQWTVLEDAGAVFLPAAGLRNGTSFNGLGSWGIYWSASTYLDGSSAFSSSFDDSFIQTVSSTNLNCGNSVRLVHDAQ